MAPPGGNSEEAARFERLYQEYAPSVIAYVARRVPSDLVADTVAETFAVAWRRLDRVPASPGPWLLAVARRVAANQRRGLRRRAALVERAASQLVTSAEPQAPSQVLEALAALPERDREAILLLAWEGLSASEAAEVLGCSATAYRLRLYRARRKLAAQLDAMTEHQSEHLRTVLPPQERA